MSYRIAPTLNPRNLARTLEAGVPAKALRDIMNRIRFGQGAPLSDELIWIDPMAVERHYKPDPDAGAPRFRRSDSGKIVPGDWDKSCHPIGSSLKYKACLAHFRDGVPWEDTGLFDEMLKRIAKDGVADECRTLEDIKRRYAALDKLAAQIRSTGQIEPRHRLGPAYFRREHGGVLVHIDRKGGVLRAGGGQHRFAIARALGLRLMPAQLGVIHPEAVANGMLAGLRNPPHSGRG